MNLYTQNINNALKTLDISERDLSSKLNTAQPAIDKFIVKVNSGEFPAFKEALNVNPEIIQTMSTWKKNFEHIIFLGMGGSSLGGQLINQFADTAGLKNPRLHFLDHLNPLLTGKIDLKKTAVIAISKSGGTTETMIQTLLLAKDFSKKNLELKNQWLVVTEPHKSALYNFAEQHNIPHIPHNPNVGGRYSIMIETGILPALLKGLNPSKIHIGMKSVVDDFIKNPLTSLPSQGAALNAVAEESGKSINVLYTYGERFRLLPDWFQQLWAESLGKEGKGTTPLGAIGPAHQHSIQQLFLAGKKDKLFTLLIPKSANFGSIIPKQNLKPELSNITTGTFQEAMGEGTKNSLIKRGHPVRTIKVNDFSEEVLGAILMHFMLETVIAGAIWGINPFNQPAVEESKTSTMEALKNLTL